MAEKNIENEIYGNGIEIAIIGAFIDTLFMRNSISMEYTL